MSAPLDPVHVVYGGAHLFKAGTATKLGALASQLFERECPTPETMSRLLGITPGETATRVHERVQARLSTQAIQDYRIDFEDGYGPRPDAEEDAHAAAVAREIDAGASSGSLPPLLGIRIKALSGLTETRARRTLEIFFKTLRVIPEGFVVTLPKVSSVHEVSTLAKLLAGKNVGIELMIETPLALFSSDGRGQLTALVAAAGGKCQSVHFGAYDYLSSCGISNQDQHLLHPHCDFVRAMMQAQLAPTGVRLADGATTEFPVGDAVQSAWAKSYRAIRHACSQGFYQGWDLHPAQIPVRWIATYMHFHEGLGQALERLKKFTESSAQAVLSGSAFDDAATGQGLLNHLIRGHESGALGPGDISPSGLTLDELKTRSFARILASRTGSRH